MSSEIHVSCPWEPILGFQGWSEYSRFRTWIDEQLRTDIARELVVESFYGGAFSVERWFLHVASEEVWRLVAPDAPFRGVFLRVSDEERVPMRNIPIPSDGV